MSHSRTFVLHAALVLVPFLGLTACEDKKSPSTPVPAGSGAKADDHAHKPGDSHADHSHDGHDHGGGTIDLGTLSVGTFTVQASRGKGDIVAGKDAMFDVTITPKDAGGMKAAAVRFWIGTEDAKGSVKAKAEMEGPQGSNRWHTHAEVPSPIPAGSKLWIEIEDSKGAKHVASVELKK